MPEFVVTVPQIVWGIIVLLFVTLALIAAWKWFRAWQLSMQAWMAKYEAGVMPLLLLQMRGADVTQLVNTGILAKREGMDVSIDQLAHHQLACGNIRLVVNAMLSAKRYNFPLSFERSAAIDLMGRDPVQLVAEAVYEANQIRIPTADSSSFSASGPGAGIMKDSLPPISQHVPINSAAVLLQATAGMVGVVMDAPRVHAQVRFPQGDLHVLVQCTQVPRPGERLAISRVDGTLVLVTPADEKTQAAHDAIHASAPAATQPLAPATG